MSVGKHEPEPRSARRIEHGVGKPRPCGSARRAASTRARTAPRAASSDGSRGWQRLLARVAAAAGARTRAHLRPRAAAAAVRPRSPARALLQCRAATVACPRQMVWQILDL